MRWSISRLTRISGGACLGGEVLLTNCVYASSSTTANCIPASLMTSERALCETRRCLKLVVFRGGPARLSAVSAVTRLLIVPTSIKDMPEHSRPREKLREKGAASLTDEKLVAAILGMGTAGIDVRTMARQVAGLIREHREALTLDHLLSVPGMGLA